MNDTVIIATIRHDAKGNVAGVRLSGETTGEGMIATAAALAKAVAQQNNLTVESGLLLVARNLGFDLTRDEEEEP